VKEQSAPFDQLRRGVDCVGCGRLIKLNRKRLNRTMMQYLYALYTLRASGWIQASRIRIAARAVPGAINQIQTGDYAVLTVWGLTELWVGKPGFARITSRGIAFVEKREVVPGAVFLWNDKNEFYRFDANTPLVSFDDAARTSFEFADL
jgi:hypothetical protein